MRKEIEEWINSTEEIYSGTHWFKVIDDFDGQPCLRTFALNKKKTHGIRVKEVIREYLDGKMFIHGDLYFCGAAGYKVKWENGKYNGYYMPRNTDDNWYEVSYEKRLGISAIDLFDAKAVQEIFSKYIPYFFYSEDVGLNVIEYAIRYKEYNSVEMLAKAGFGFLAKDKRVLKLGKQKKKALIKWLNDPVNNEYAQQYPESLNYNIISQCIKHGINIDDWFHDRDMKRYQEVFESFGFKVTLDYCDTVYKYLNSGRIVQNIGLRDYVDYLSMAKELGLDITAKNVAFPIDAARAHDQLKSRKSKTETRMINKKLKDIKNILQRYSFSYKGLKIVVPENRQDFIKWGKELHICVGSYGYDNKMCKGETIVFCIYQDDKPLECCEVAAKNDDAKIKLIQLRGEHNQDSERHSDALKLANKFIKNYKNNQVFGCSI